MLIEVLFLLIFSHGLTCNANGVYTINSSNWQETFEGEWFIEFFAPWCPACRQFSATWTRLSTSSDVKAHIAAVDVTESPVLSFVFFVRRLPTLFHAKDGVFRLYNGSREFLDLRNYLVDEAYMRDNPIPWYYSPSSFHMGIFFKMMELGMAVTRFHQYLLDSGYSGWMSVAFIGSGTILFGILLGTVLVILFDFFIPPRPQILRLLRGRFREPAQSQPKTTAPADDEKSSDPCEVARRQSVDGSGEHEDTDDLSELRQRAPNHAS